LRAARPARGLPSPPPFGRGGCARGGRRALRGGAAVASPPLRRSVILRPIPIPPTPPAFRPPIPGGGAAWADAVGVGRGQGRRGAVAGAAVGSAWGALLPPAPPTFFAALFPPPPPAAPAHAPHRPLPRSADASPGAGMARQVAAPSPLRSPLPRSADASPGAGMARQVAAPSPLRSPLPRSADASPRAGSARQVAAQTRPGRRSRGRHRSRGCWCPFASAAGRGGPCPASRSPAASEAIKPARPSRAGGLAAPIINVSSSPVRASLPPPALSRCGQSARGLASAGRAASAPAPGPRPPTAGCPWLRVR